MNKFFIACLLAAALSACTSGQKEDVSNWQGEWSATWETDPATFGQMEGVTDYTMPGKITFSDEKVNIKAFGFKGCAFSVDTLDHSLNWEIHNDSLILSNDDETPGLVYQIKEQSDQKIRLQLMDDIFLTLTRSSETL